MSVYRKLGVKRVINCQFALTRLGGSTLPEEVITAMNEANEEWVWIWDLQEQVSKIISEITGAESAHVSCGAFAGLVLSAAACITGKDTEKMMRLPDTTGMKNEIIIQKCIRSNMYDRSMEVPGGKMIVVGDEKSCTSDQIESAINEKTAAIHYLAGENGPWWWSDTEEEYPWNKVNPVSIEEVVKIGKRNDVPIVVDAAGKTWPLNELTKYAAMGCDLVVYGGKYFWGPHSTGIVVGRKDLVEAVALHSFIGYESGPEITPGVYKSVGRGYKLDRQEIVGLVVALQRWMSMDHNKERINPAFEKAEYIKDSLETFPNVKTKIIPKREEKIPYHRLTVLITLEDKSPEETAEIRRKLLEGDPSVWLSANENNLVINTMFLLKDDEKDIVKKLTPLIT